MPIEQTDVYLVTGSNSGLGLSSVRELASVPSTKKVYMACRSESKAKSAVQSLDFVDTNKLKYVHFDASESKKDIVNIVNSIDDKITGLLLNAGGIGHEKTLKPSGPNNVLDIHQINLIGHIQLLQALKEHGRLAPGCKIVFSGSEAARGVPMMMIANPKLGDTQTWYTDQLKSTSYRDPMKVYALTKAFAALYFAEWARQNTEYKVWTVSPGGTSGTAALSAKAVPLHFRVMVPIMMPIMKALGVMHSLEDGRDRYIEFLVGHEGKKYPSGTFVASKRGTTGKIVDQATLKSGKKFADKVKQRAAYEALVVFV